MKVRLWSITAEGFGQKEIYEEEVFVDTQEELESLIRYFALHYKVMISLVNREYLIDD